MIRSKTKAIYYSALSLVGADRRRISELCSTGRTVILNLHRVSPDPDPFWSPMSPVQFAGLVRWMVDNFEICSLEGMCAPATGRPRAVLSFDDGYYDFLEYALPVLEKYRVSANMNIIPQCAESGQPIWNVRLYDLLRSATVAEINSIHIPGFATKLADDSAAAKVRFGLEISRFLKNRPRAERLEIWQHIQPAISRSSARQTRMMTTDEIRTLPERVELGAHSYSHESMGFETDEFFVDDLDRCESYFDDKLGISLSVYAFPNGSYRPSQIDVLRQRGVRHILLVDEKFAKPGSGVYPRITMYGDSLAEIRLKALGY